MECLRNLNIVAILVRMCLCVICGGAVGIERERRHRTAGVKTHVLVCMGAAICMVTGQYAVNYFNMPSIDPTRIGAQVVSGIGFLGVGTIITTRSNQVKGLTTAAGLWVSACIGLAIGIGFYELALIASVFVVSLLVIVKRIVTSDVSMTTGFFLELKNSDYIKEILEMIKKENCATVKMNIKYTTDHSIGVIMDIHGMEEDLEKIFQEIQKKDYVIYFEEFLG